MNRISKFAKQTFKLLVISSNTYSRHKNIQLQKFIPAYGFWWYFTKKDQPVSDNKITTNIIRQADELFDDEKYLEAYNLLSSYNRSKNIELDWRICRALYKMSKTDNYDKQTKYAMILEAYDIISESLMINENSAEAHKWMAIILDAKLQFQSRFSKVEDNIRIKNHLMEANKIYPNDFTVLHMLGQWHYKFCNLTWFQKKLTKFMFNEPPVCNYEEALTYFSKAEELRPRFYLSNIYMLGKLNYQMGNLFRAHYYLAIAAQMTPNTSQEEKCVNSARNLVARLKNYDVTDEAL